MHEYRACMHPDGTNMRTAGKTTSQQKGNREKRKKQALLLSSQTIQTTLRLPTDHLNTLLQHYWLKQSSFSVQTVPRHVVCEHIVSHTVHSTWYFCTEAADCWCDVGDNESLTALLIRDWQPQLQLHSWTLHSFIWGETCVGAHLQGSLWSFLVNKAMFIISVAHQSILCILEV